MPQISRICKVCRPAAISSSIDCVTNARSDASQSTCIGPAAVRTALSTISRLQERQVSLSSLERDRILILRDVGGRRRRVADRGFLPPFDDGFERLDHVVALARLQLLDDGGAVIAHAAAEA